MQPITIFLSQIMAFVFMVLALSLWANKKFYADVFKQIEKDKVALFFGAIIEMVVGIAIILQHNLWGSVPEVLVTLIGWSAILEGVTALFWTKRYKKIALSIFIKKGTNLAIGVMLTIGLYLAWVGFMG